MIPDPALHARRELVHRDPATLIAHAGNARTHSAGQVREIRASIDAFGPTNPILIDDAEPGGIIAGHGRQMAALLDPPMAEFPCVVLTGLSEQQRRALVIADNKLALNAGWDLDLLRAELTDLRGGGADLALMGFSAADLADLLPEAARADEASPRSDFSYQEQYGCVVMCADEAAQRDTYEALLALGYTVKVVAT